MTDEKYDVIFSGKILPGQDPAAVRERIGKLFRVGDAQLEVLFSGTPVSIKKQIDLDTAVRYRTAIQDAGALVEVKKSALAAPAAESAPQRGAQPRPAESTPTPRASAESEGMTLAPANTGSLEGYAPPVIPAPIPDTSSIDLSPVGEDLSSDVPPPPLDLDTSSINLSPEGADLSADTPPPTLEIDTDELSLLPPNTGSLEDCQEEPYPTPIPDISHLNIVPPADSGDPKDRSG